MWKTCLMGCCWLSWSSLSRPGPKLSRLWAVKGSQCSWVRNEAPRGSETERPSSSAQPWSWPRFGVGGSSSGPLYCLVCLPFPRNPATTQGAAVWITFPVPGDFALLPLCSPWSKFSILGNFLLQQIKPDQIQFLLPLILGIMRKELNELLIMWEELILLQR